MYSCFYLCKICVFIYLKIIMLKRNCLKKCKSSFLKKNLKLFFKLKKRIEIYT